MKTLLTIPNPSTGALKVIDENAPPIGWPAPQVLCREVGVDDPHVPNAARLAYRKAVKAGWDAKLTYACGTSMVGKDCTPGPIMESVVLRLSRLSAPSLAVATWEARARALCEPCGKSLLPSPDGVFIAHAGANYVPCEGGLHECKDREGLAWWVCVECHESKRVPPSGKIPKRHRSGDYQPCPGSGQPAIGDAGERAYAFTCAYVTQGPGWWTTEIPERVDAKRFAAILEE